MPVVGIKDVQEDNDDEKRQAYYAGGQGQNGGGRWRRSLLLRPRRTHCAHCLLSAAGLEAARTATERA